MKNQINSPGLLKLEYQRFSIYILLLSFTLLFIEISNAQVFYRETGTFSDTAELYPMFRKSFEIKDSFVNNKMNFYKMYIFKIKDKKYLTIDGRFDVYEWKNNNWVNLYKKQFNGYNNHSKKFVYNNEIYSFGGYGYWRCHGDLIKFLWDRNEWEIVVYGDEEPVGNGYAFFFNGKLNVINPVRFIDGYLSQRKISSSFSIDMKTLKTKELNTTFNRDFDIGPKYWFETENYYLLLEKPDMLIDKKTTTSYVNGLRTFDCLWKILSSDILIYSKNDTLVMMDRNMKLKCRYDMAEEVKKYKPVVKNNAGIKLLVGFSVLLALATTGYLYFRQKRRSQKAVNSIIKFDDPRIEELSGLSVRQISVEELDVILGIQNIRNSETQRFKRSQIINSINQEAFHKTGKVLISRIQDPEDKRRFLYRINGNEN